VVEFHLTALFFSTGVKNMLILNTDEVRTALPMADAIQAMRRAYAAFSSGRAQVPLRAHLPIPPYKASGLFMPAFVQDEEGDALAVKAVSIYPENPLQGLPLIHAAVLVFEPHTGRPLALLAGGALTAIRTGAAAGAATGLLARPDAKTAAIFGAGIQARTQLEAICEVRNIETAWIVDPSPGKAPAFVEEMAGTGKIPRDLRVAADPAEAVAHADIICTATTSKQPVYPAAAVSPGTHINGVGSYTLDMIENPPEIYSRACAFVDSRDAVLAEAGETVTAINQKLLFPAELTELGDVILGKEQGRFSLDQITFFKSVGLAVQDAMAAQVAIQNAMHNGLGQEVPF
jgi:alanine dehydrogenase